MAELGKRPLIALALCVVLCQSWALAQTLGSAPQFNRAVQGQTGAQPEGAFMNIVNWVGNVIAPVGASAARRSGARAWSSWTSWADGASRPAYSLPPANLQPLPDTPRLGIAGEQELINLTYSQDVVVTVPGNTRLFLVFQQGLGRERARPGLAPASNRPVASVLASSKERTELPSAAELRELVELKQEPNRMYREAAAKRTRSSATAPR
jgi:hypothetical protein